MATLYSYSAVFGQNAFANAAVVRWRFDETSGTTAIDRVDGIDGTYQGGVELDQAGIIGDGAANFDGTTGILLVEQTLTGALTVAAFGDSEIAATDYSAGLESALEARGLDATVLNRGVSGETTTDGLNRVDGVIAENPDLVILELGTNDAIQTFDPDTSAANLTSMVQDFDAAGIAVLLTGAFGFYPDFEGGSGYPTEEERSDFEAIFPTVANNLDVALLDSGGSMFLGGTREGDTIIGGVLGDPDLNVDGLHPNAAGVEQIVSRTTEPTIEVAAAAGLVSDALELANGSVELWFTPDVIDGQQMLYSRVQTGGHGGDVEILLDGAEVAVGLRSNSATFVIEGGDVEAGDATHVVFTFGSGGMQLYVNDALVAQDEYTGGLVGNIQEAGVGARANSFYEPLPFHGVIDEVAFYDRELTANQIDQLFVAGGHGTAIVGTAADDRVIGGSDNEDLRGRGGDDLLSGGAGNDDLRGGAGEDDLRGGAGDDRLWGQGGDDVLGGGAGDDLLNGNGGQDALNGGRDADRLFGGGGVDNLNGGAGDDLLNGGAGADNLTGGAGSDTFQISRVSHGVDRILDFQSGAGADVLDLHNVLNFQDGEPVSNFVQLSEVDGNTEVGVNANGAGTDFTAVFNLIGTTGLDLNTLVNDGNVQVAAPPTS